MSKKPAVKKPAVKKPAVKKPVAKKPTAAAPAHYGVPRTHARAQKMGAVPAKITYDDLPPNLRADSDQTVSCSQATILRCRQRFPAPSGSPPIQCVRIPL